MRATSDYNLGKLHADLAKEWHPTKNGKLTPYDVTPMSHLKVWWKCGQGHEWQAIVKSRSIGRGCPYCAGKKVTKNNNLAIIHPELTKEWHPTKNGDLTPYDVFPNSQKKRWWICKRGHEWLAIVSNRSRGRGCQKCYREHRREKQMV